MPLDRMETFWPQYNGTPELSGGKGTPLCRENPKIQNICSLDLLGGQQKIGTEHWNYKKHEQKEKYGPEYAH